MEIQINRKRLVTVIILYTVIILLIASLVYYLYYYEEKISYGLTALLVLSLLVYPFVAIKFFKLFNSSKPGLIIDDNGLVDNLNSVKLGTIERGDIKGIRIAKEFYSNYIIVDLVLPEKYTIEKKGFEKIQINSLIKKYGSPCVINAGSLNCNFEELQNIFKRYLSKK